MTTHTAGNWYVDAAPDGLRVLTDDRRSTIICQQIGPAQNKGAQADARLISAAPDLLEALQASRAQWIHSVNADKCLAAIAKATGEQA